MHVEERMIGRMLVSFKQAVTQLVSRRRVPELFHSLFDREAAGPLTRGELLEACDMLRHDHLRRDDDERVLDEPSYVIACLMLRPLERIGAQVEQQGHPQLYQRLRPDVEAMRPLFHEYGLPLLVTKAGEVAVIGPIEELAAFVRALAAEQITLVVTVEVNPEILAGGIVTLQKLGLDVRLASGS